ncbi:hypothetical protein KEM52_000944 [Ascosphaera acerosa]|nr:hypothetical protein KEM52_000944 [Ascosphaera acerosa]
MAANQCNICLETPRKYGLFIPNEECIRAWRSGSSGPKDNRRKCPICRTPTPYIIPSDVLPVPENADKGKDSQGKGLPTKQELVNKYLQQRKAIPCRNFQKSVSGWQREQARRARGTEQSKRPSKTVPFRGRCQYGNDCLFAHIHPQTGEPYIFTEKDIEKSNQRDAAKRLRAVERRRRTRPSDPASFAVSRIDSLMMLWETHRERWAYDELLEINADRVRCGRRPLSLTDPDYVPPREPTEEERIAAIHRAWAPENIEATDRRLQELCLDAGPKSSDDDGKARAEASEDAQTTEPCPAAK